MKQIPITIVTGYLGSGKTTLLKNILQAQHGKKIAIIQNEFGVALGIEEAMIVNEEGHKNFEWLELNNGCICCTIKHDFIRTLETLIKKKNHALDYIIIETDGRVDPSSIIEIFWLDEELKSPVYLDAVITVVDASLILKQLSRCQPQFVNEAERQIAFADKIILNKQELMTQVDLNQIRQTLLNINGLASIEVTSYSQVDIAAILNTKEFGRDKFLKIVESLNPNHQHDSDVTTLTLRVDHRAIDIDRFNLFMDKLIWDKENPTIEIYRMKGVLNVDGDANKYSLQCVEQLFILEPSSVKWPEFSVRYNKIVFIGRCLDLDLISRLFERCLI